MRAATAVGGGESSGGATILRSPYLLLPAYVGARLDCRQRSSDQEIDFDLAPTSLFGVALDHLY